MKLFTFKTGGEFLGIAAKYVYRVLDEVKITPVCLTPPCYLGLMYHRGELFDVVDIGILLEKEKPAFEEAERIVILRWSDKALAIAPGSINGLIWIDNDSETSTFFTPGGDSIRLITPEEIWDRLLRLKHGSVKI